MGWNEFPAQGLPSFKSKCQPSWALIWTFRFSSEPIQVVGRIQFLRGIGLWFPSSCWLSDGVALRSQGPPWGPSHMLSPNMEAYFLQVSRRLSSKNIFLSLCLVGRLQRHYLHNIIEGNVITGVSTLSHSEIHTQGEG